MRKTKAIEIASREITVKDLKVRDIYDLVQKSDQGEGVFFGELRGVVERSTGLSISEFLDCSITEIEEIWDAVLEVNESFLSLARKIGLEKKMQETIDYCRQKLNKAFSDLLLGATDQPATSGTTDTPSS